MDALLLALLLGLLLDQGDRSQGLARLIGARFARRPARAVLPVVAIILIAASVTSLAGMWLGQQMEPRPRLMFLAFTLLLGGGALIMPDGLLRRGGKATEKPFGALTARLFIQRFMDRSSLALLGVAAFSVNGWASALGGSLGGLAALLPPLLAGEAYERVMPLRFIKMAGGALLLISGAITALNAMRLV